MSKKLKSNAFLSIVKERPDFSLSVEYPYCPYCKNSNKDELELICHTQTLVGGGPGRDSNHHHREYKCENCGWVFYMENKGCMVWYTEKETLKVLDGIPCCFEKYVYTCKKCDGEVHRHYIELDSDEDVGSSLRYKDGIPQFRIFFRCHDCGIEVQSKNEYFSPYAYLPKKRGRPRTKPTKLKLNWKITEEIGVALINDYAVSKVETINFSKAHNVAEESVSIKFNEEDEKSV